MNSAGRFQESEENGGRQFVDHGVRNFTRSSECGRP